MIPDERLPRRRATGRLLLAAWAAAVALGAGSLMVGHWAPLPAPAVAAEEVRADLVEATPAGATVRGIHLLDADCPCSMRIARHLIERGARIPGVAEVVMLLGDAPGDTAAALRGAGFAVETPTRAGLEARFGSAGVPSLLALSVPGGASLYAGGYTTRKQGLDVRDVLILAACARGESPTPLPVLGCGASDSLRAALDPLGLK